MENIRDLILDILYLRYLSLSGDVESSVKFTSLEFTGEICAVDINLGVVGILVEFRAMRADEITKYATDVEKRNCLRSKPGEFCTLDVRNIRLNQQRQRRNYL